MLCIQNDFKNPNFFQAFIPPSPGKIVLYLDYNDNFTLDLVFRELTNSIVIEFIITMELVPYSLFFGTNSIVIKNSYIWVFL
jgi:hypothetical protein